MPRISSIDVVLSKVEEELLIRRAAFADSGQYPFSIDEEGGLESLQAKLLKPTEDFEAIIQKAKALDLDRWIDDQRKTQGNKIELGTWSGPREGQGLYKAEDFSELLDVFGGSEFSAPVGLAEIKAAWELPAALGFGGWPGCHPPEIHCAFALRWQQRYGAVIASVGPEALEWHIERPPEDQESAVQLAWEMALYCPPILKTRVKTVHDLAAVLIGAKGWAHSWDRGLDPMQAFRWSWLTPKPSPEESASQRASVATRPHEISATPRAAHPDHQGRLSKIAVAGDDALAELQARRAAYTQTGEYPILIGEAPAAESFLEFDADPTNDSDEVLLASESIDVEAWIQRKRGEWEEEEEIEIESYLGEWPGEMADKGSIRAHTNVLNNQIRPQVELILAKIDQPWKLPAVVRFGGWNDCPESEVLCAFFRRWQERYGAEIVALHNDLIECTVKNPPRDEAAAMELAWEQFWFSFDIVDQGYETVQNLAATLLNSDYWYFWWD